MILMVMVSAMSYDDIDGDGIDNAAEGNVIQTAMESPMRL